MSKQEEVKNLPAKPLTPETAIEAIKKDFPNEAAILDAVLKNNVVVLGTDQAFALRDAEGDIKAFKRTIPLTAKEGTLVQPVPGGPFVVAAQGYEVWAESVGACVIMPPQVLVDGQMQMNPHVIRDPQNRRILAIYARAVAFRFSPMGLPMVSDWTTIFDNPSYRLIDLLAKAKKTPQAFRLLPIDMSPVIDENGKETWTRYPFDESTSLWVNTSHEEALTWYAQIINREKKSIDFAQTFAKRNALKHLSGIQRAPADTFKITVTAWRPTSGNIIKWDATQYVELQGRVGKMVTGDRKEFGKIEHITGGQEHVSGHLEPIEEEERDDAVTTDNGKGTVIELTEADKKLLANLKTTKKSFPDEYAKACEALGIDQNAEIEPVMAAKVMQDIKRQMEE